MATARKKTKEFDWCAALDKTFTERFGLKNKVKTTFNIMLGTCVTTRADGKPLTNEQRAYIDGYMDRHGATD